MTATPAKPQRLLLLAALALAVLAGGVRPAGAQAACPFTPEPGYRMLFDGTPASAEAWKMAGPGSFTVTDCTLKGTGGMGLYWYAGESFESYSLKLEWKIEKLVDNSGIFVGFPDPGTDPWVAVNQGYEVQIDQIGRSDGAPKHYTGAIYDFQGPDMDKVREAVEPLDWNTYEIIVDDPVIQVVLNGVVVNTFTSTHPARDLSNGHFGLQNHGQGEVTSFRNIRVKPLPAGGGQPLPPASGALPQLRNNVGIAQLPTSNANFDGVGYSYSSVALEAAGVKPGGAVTAGGFSFTWPATASGASDNVVARGQTVPVVAPRGATRLGLLTAADHGPSAAALTLTYLDAEGRKVVRSAPLTVGDWTLNGGGADPSPGNVVAVATEFRTMSSAVPMPTKAYVFAVSVPLDPELQLVEVKLPLAYAGAIHVFDLAVR